jgi:hypothetical protein
MAPSRPNFCIHVRQAAAKSCTSRVSWAECKGAAAIVSSSGCTATGVDSS